jgi:hypothetical protein
MSEQDEYGDKPISPEFVEKLASLTDDEAENRAKALRSGLDEFDLDEDDLSCFRRCRCWQSLAVQTLVRAPW